MDCPFAQLGLDPGANEQTVRAAFRRLALRHHPDHGGDATTFARLRRAYERCLVDVRLRSSIQFVNPYRGMLSDLEDAARRDVRPAPRRKPSGLTFDETLSIVGSLPA
jgi:curved DNA-binding protein CbpA